MDGGCGGEGIEAAEVERAVGLKLKDRLWHGGWVPA
jgi:hypothetical protein